MPIKFPSALIFLHFCDGGHKQVAAESAMEPASIADDSTASAGEWCSVLSQVEGGPDPEEVPEPDPAPLPPPDPIPSSSASTATAASPALGPPHRFARHTTDYIRTPGLPVIFVDTWTKVDLQNVRERTPMTHMRFIKDLSLIHI